MFIRRSMVMLVLASLAGSGLPATASEDTPFWSDRPDEQSFYMQQTKRLEQARATIAELKAVKGKRTIENTLKLYDRALIHIEAVSNQASLIEHTHPLEEMRSVGERLSQEASRLSTELSLDPDVYRALAAIDLEKADPITAYFVKKEMRDFKLQGADKDPETRAKIKALRDELVTIGQDFSRNIRDDVREVYIQDAKKLDGLPQDYIDKRKPDETGNIKITTAYPDILPIFNYAKDGDLRKQMLMEFRSRAYPANTSVLQSMIEKRHELANLLGFDNWAEYVTADKMVGSAQNASDFIDRLVDASTERSKADYEVLLAARRKDDPSAKAVNGWESSYYSEQVRKAQYDFDAQALRPYFAYDDVLQGVLDVSSKLFGVTFRKLEDAHAWDESVGVYEMLEGGKVTGRFYLDMHPRDGKFGHAAQFDIRTGVKGMQIPEAALVCNFPMATEDDPGLMEFSQVETFFHEFGHLLHTLFAGQQQWCGIGGIRTEWDFVEAPSQMLEEWALDAKTLATFARHHETGEALPAEMIQKLRKARAFGRGMGIRRQMVLARISLSFYDRPPDEVDMDAIVKHCTEQYSPIPFFEGTHMQCSFGHLDGYSAIYYTYKWSEVIAKDLFSQFNHDDLLDATVAKRYRDKILARGGSAPAAELVSDFLGREFSFDSYKAWLDSSE